NVSPRLGPACHWYAAGTARSVIPPRRYSMIDVAAAPCPRGARRLPTLARQWRRSQPALPANGSPTADRLAGAGPLHSVSWAHGSGPTSGKKASDHVGTFRRSGLLGLVLLGTGLGSAGLGGHRGPAARVTAGRH